MIPSRMLAYLSTGTAGVLLGLYLIGCGVPALVCCHGFRYDTGEGVARAEEDLRAYAEAIRAGAQTWQPCDVFGWPIDVAAGWTDAFSAAVVAVPILAAAALTHLIRRTFVWRSGAP